MEQNIIISIDHSQQSERAVKCYLEKLHRPGNKVILVHCLELPELNVSKARDSHISPSVLASMWKEEECKLKNLEDKMTAILKDYSVSGILRTVSGRAGEVVCGIANEENASLIVVGTRGCGKVRRALLGSVSDYLVKNAPCPVVVCKDDQDRQRNFSGEKTRQPSGDSFAASLRQRFASGGRAKSQTQPSTFKNSKDDDEDPTLKENTDPECAN